MDSLSSEVWQHALSDSWNLLNGLGGILFQAVVFAMTAIFTWRKEGRGALSKIWRSGLSGFGLLAGAWIITLLLHFAVLSPRALLKEERVAKTKAENDLKFIKNATPAPMPPFQITETDPEARKQLQETRDELKAAKETIRALDPLQQRIASATATAVVFVKSDENDGSASHNMGGGGIVAFGRGSEALLRTDAMNASSETQNSKKTIYLVFNSPIQGLLVGKPLTELAAAEYVQLDITERLGDASVIGGTIIFTLNGSHRFEFPIPAQKAIGQKIFVRDLYQMRSQLKPNP